jgi:hypothetical protein
VTTVRRGRGRAGRADLVYPFAAPPPPTAVILPNDLVDYLMPACDGPEWKILCAVLRHQHESSMSVTSLMRWTGIASREGCHAALTRCLAKGYLIREARGTSFAYRPNPQFAMQRTTATPVRTASR